MPNWFVWRLIIVFFVFSVSVAHCEEPSVGCVIWAYHEDGKKHWAVKGWYKPPNMPKKGKVLGTEYKSLIKATKACDEWMKEKMELLPLTIPQPEKKEQVARR